MALEKINSYLQHTLREDFTSPNPEVRKGAIYALGRLGSGPEVLLILKNVAAADDDPEVRYTAKKALNYWEGVLSEPTEDPEPVEITGPDGGLDPARFAEALGATQAGQQIHAIVEAVKLGDGACLPALHERLASEGDPWVLSMMVKAMGSLGGAREVEALAPLLEHENHRVVANTVEALEMLGDDAIAGRLEPLLLSTDNRVRANAVKALHPHDPDKAMKTLESMAVNHRPWMRASAIYCLKVLDDERCEGLLLEMVSKEYTEDLARQMLDAVVAQGSARAVGVLALLTEKADGERLERFQTALEVLSRKLDLDEAAVEALLVAQRKRDQAASGLQSGMFDVGNLDDDDEDEAPKGPVVTLGNQPPAQGYGKLPEGDSAVAEDPGSRQFVVVALVLAVAAATYGGYRMLYDPPEVQRTVPETRPGLDN